MAILAVFAVCAILAPAVLAGGNDSCFGSLGCFSNQSPWSDLLRPIPAPQSPAVIDMHFYLHTRNAPNGVEIQHPADGIWDISGTDYNSNRKTVVLIHGFVQTAGDPALMDMRDAILFKEDVNVIVADWKETGLLTYFQLVSNARVMGATTAQLLKYLIADKGLTANKLHLIGYSLGAHISAYVGKAIPNVARISALDAAQPLFEGYDPRVRLNLTDAVFIDAIHTDARPFIPLLGFGYQANLGHVDFYVNGGYDQPGCLARLKPNITSIWDLGTATINSFVRYVRCPHDRAQELFAAQISVQNCTFWGHKTTTYQRAMRLLSVATFGLTPKLWSTVCDKDVCTEMGYDSIHYPARGSFDVLTSGSLPFCYPEPSTDTIMAKIYQP